MRFGLVGLGEAGTAIASSLARVEGLTVAGWDVRLAEGAARTGIAARVGPSVTLAGSLAELVEGSETLLCLVTPTASVSVAAEAAPWLGPGHLYIDANSISPARVAEVARVVGPSGARFLDAAVMAAVPPHGHSVPMLLSGRHAGETGRLLDGFGFRFEAVGEQAGMASATKMVRSVIVKGIEALLLESLAAAWRLGVAEAVLSSLDAAFPEGTWREKADYFASRTGRHAARRAAELAEAVDALTGVGVEATVTEAARRRLAAAAAAIENLPEEERPQGFEHLVSLLDRDPGHVAR